MEHKFNILMIIAVFYPYTGGAEKQAERLALELNKKNIKVTVLTGRWDNRLEKAEELNGVRVLRNRTNLLIPKKNSLNADISFFRPPRKPGILGIFRKIYVRLCVYFYQITLLCYLLSHGRKYDVIHVHQILYPAFISTLASAIIKKPVIAKVGSSGINSDINQIKKFPEGRRQLRYILAHLTRLVCTSRKMEQEFSHEGMDGKKISLIRNGVRIEEFTRSYRSSKRLVYLGRLIKSKDIPSLIIAFSHLLKKYDNLRLTLIGDGPEKYNIIRLIKEYKMENNIKMTGMVKEPGEILKENDIFIFPSLVEGLSNSLIEAMSFKLPCIATNIHGNIEVIGRDAEAYNIARGDFMESEAGIMVNKGDTDAIVKAAGYLIENEDARKRLGENAYLRIKQEFDIKNITESYIMLYEEVAG
jgi:glycosyltransferase involved in cell wall biosynthesis